MRVFCAIRYNGLKGAVLIVFTRTDLASRRRLQGFAYSFGIKRDHFEVRLRRMGRFTSTLRLGVHANGPRCEDNWPLQHGTELKSAIGRRERNARLSPL
jgi:hypothetical protein